MDSIQYLEWIKDYHHIIKSLDDIVRASGDVFEGNCFYIHTTFDSTPERVNKQTNLVNISKKANNILEIGFNAGHSTLLMLLSNPECHVSIVDICQHPYTLPCYNLLKTLFPWRLHLYPGPSAHVMMEKLDAEPFDLIHIDGAHDEYLASIDFENSRKKSRPGTIVVFDDTDIPHLKKIWDRYIENQVVTEITDILPATHSMGTFN